MKFDILKDWCGLAAFLAFATGLLAAWPALQAAMGG